MQNAAPQIPNLSEHEENVAPLFRSLLASIEGLKAPPLEKQVMIYALRFLLAESQQARLRRDHATIKDTWKGVHPFLHKHKLLDAYRRNDAMKMRLRFFVENGFGPMF